MPDSGDGCAIILELVIGIQAEKQRWWVLYTWSSEKLQLWDWAFPSTRHAKWLISLELELLPPPPPNKRAGGMSGQYVIFGRPPPLCFLQDLRVPRPYSLLPSWTRDLLIASYPHHPESLIGQDPRPAAVRALRTGQGRDDQAKGRWGRVHAQCLCLGEWVVKTGKLI